MYAIRSYYAPNLGPEAMITYYYDESYESLKKQRSKVEKALIKDEKDTPYPTYDKLKAEEDEKEPQLVFTIKDAQGNVIKKEMKSPKKGLQRFV